jgi:5-methyltetrahydrofolate--homocysteine methyltransferase
MADSVVPPDVVKKLGDALRQGEEDAAVAATRAALQAGVDPLGLIQEVIVPTLTAVGDLFENLEVFLPELMAAGVAGTACSEVIEDELTKSGAQLENEGVVVIGTVKGDIHDIGKNILASLLKAHGYQVVDVGKDASAQRFIEAAKQSRADILAASSIMSITRAGCRDVADLLRELNLSDKYALVVGGGSIDQEYADDIGANGYSFTAAGGVELIGKLIAEKAGA